MFSRKHRNERYIRFVGKNPDDIKDIFEPGCDEIQDIEGRTEGHGYQIYRGDPPLGINIDMTRAEIRHLWGEPDFSRGVMTLPHA
ncbi:hypothetical protein ACM0P6_11935 [Komagataeibacter sucrofermentans]|uniref:hypothetical protein n=1 Tax=Komagataeibacter sucrofermentans TaxID=1053551 RepID=UPI0011B59E38|nr:hypothetical protein [Komagataeibacter sucrofermentans]